MRSRARVMSARVRGERDSLGSSGAPRVPERGDKMTACRAFLLWVVGCGVWSTSCGGRIDTDEDRDDGGVGGVANGGAIGATSARAGTTGTSRAGRGAGSPGGGASASGGHAGASANDPLGGAPGRVAICPDGTLVRVSGPACGDGEIHAGE